jgi:hypothetical protein
MRAARRPPSVGPIARTMTEVPTVCATRDESWPPISRYLEAGPPLHRLGPPGWSEFTAARKRFETTLAIQCLERAAARPESPEPARRTNEA